MVNQIKINHTIIKNQECCLGIEVQVQLDIAILNEKPLNELLVV